MSETKRTDGIRLLREQAEVLREQIAAVDARTMEAEQEAHAAREEILSLRDQVAAAQRDQQDLKTAHARIARYKRHVVVARIVNRP